MSDIDNEWEPGSTDFSDYEGEIIGAKFQVNQYSTRPEIELELATDDPKLPVWHERYTLGATTTNDPWLVLDDGATVEASSGKFRDNSNYGKLINKAVKLAGKDLTGAGSPREAAVWLGLRFRFTRVKGSFKNKETGETVDFSHNFPSAYLGKV